ncbi:MAG: 4-hydroxythreonine-4-phosphate dehydrogenase PdxA [Elusimicrobia bacterium]|nr:4-hydroxythreonine-4-phosphate dehydrogenase PdxA [Elusimicrobiota bacterium]
MLPVLAFTSGDPWGLGPEVAVKAMRDPRVARACRPLAVGPRAAVLAAGWRPSLAPLLDPGHPAGPSVRRPTPAGGRASYGAVRASAALAQRGLVGGMVTAPVSKEAWRLAGAPHLDHTQFLRDFTGSRRVAMVLVGGPFRAVLATRHIPLKDVPRAVTGAAVAEAAELGAQALREGLGLRRPRLALCALNPHGGENGLLGAEEGRCLAPAARALRRKGLRLAGPIPADAAWAAQARGEYDLLVALYHDQALVPLKAAVGYGIVNWTVGTPLLRTSPGHGTAYDIAGRGRGDAEGTVQAALLAARLAGRSPAVPGFGGAMRMPGLAGRR